MSTALASPYVQPPAPGKLVSAVLAVSVHLMLMAFLFYGIRWQTQRPEAIEVELVQAEAPALMPPPQVEPQPEAVPPPEPKAEEQPPPPPKPDIAVKQKEEPKQEKPKPPPKAAVRATPNPFKQQIEEEIKRTTASRKEAEMARAADQELAQLKAAQAATARDKAKADYIGRIRGKIRGNIVLPPDLKGNPEAIFAVVQLPSGEILSATLKKSSGHAGYDAAVERAILKSSPLPKPERGDLFARELELKFRPLEE